MPTDVLVNTGFRATGLIYRFIRLSGQYGCFPCMVGLAKTQSLVKGYGLVRRQRRRSSAMYTSSGTGFAEASVLHSPIT